MCKNLLYVVALLFFPAFAMAYHCPLEEVYLENEIHGRYIDSDLVALIKPYKIENFESEDESSSYKLIHTKVLKAWKGDASKDIVIRDVKSPISWYLPIKVNQRYVVYAKGPDKKGFYNIFTCDFETLGKANKKQNKILAKLQSGKLSISSYFSLFSRVDLFLNHDLIEGVEVTRKGKYANVLIVLDEYADDWVAGSIERFIRSEGNSLGIENVGKIEVVSKEGSKVISWVHPI